MRKIARALLVAGLLALAIVILPRSETAYADMAWLNWASIAWRYYQNCGNPTTGMTDDACGWHYFTYWGLASNILGVVDARRLGLIDDTHFLNKINPLLASLNSITLDPNTNIPYGIYSRDTLEQATGTPASDTNGADYGRYLGAMYILRQYLVQHGFTSQENLVVSAVNRVNNNHVAAMLGADLYSYYASLGFMLWEINPSATSSAQNSFQNLMQNGPFTPASSMYGVSGIPANTRIDGDPFVNAILEASEIPQIAGLASWSSFLQLSRAVYNSQEARSSSTGKPEFWTGGGLDFQPGFVSEWIVWITGQTWVTLDQNGSIFSDPRLPVAYLKLMFAYNALYRTPYTSNALNSYTDILQTPNGFKEGIYANGATNNNIELETNQIILSSARYVNPSSSSTTTSTTSSGQTATTTLLVPSVSLSPSFGSVGLTVDVSGSGFSTGDTGCSISGSVVASQTCSVSAGALSAFTAFTVADVVEGSYSVTVTGMPTGDSASTSFTVIASTPTVALSPSSAQPGMTVSVVGYGFNSADTTCTFTTPAVASSPASTCSVVNGALIGSFVVANVASGIYSITVIGSPGADSVSVSFTVNAASTSQTSTSSSASSTTMLYSATSSTSAFPDFLIAATSTITLNQGDSRSTTIAVISLNGFSSTVALSAAWIGAVPSGVSLSSISPVTPLSGSATTILTISASQSASTGTFAVQVTGTSGSLMHTMTPDIGVQILQTSSSTTSNTTVNSSTTTIPLPTMPNCAVATSTSGSELAPLAQALRSFRDQSIMKTRTGAAFMVLFNTWYYSFSPRLASNLAGHPTERTLFRYGLYPIVGILYASYYSYLIVSPLNSEIAAVAAGIVGAGLIGLVYVGPMLYLTKRLFQRRIVLRSPTPRRLVLLATVSLLFLPLAYFTGGRLLLGIAGASLTMSILTLGCIIGSLMLMRLESKHASSQAATKMRHRAFSCKRQS
jgi:hypothetical protein